MKLSLKDSLIKFNLINEGWAEDLSDKYNEDTLIFVGRILQKVYTDSDISNHPLADWIASSSKTLGELPWTEPYKSRNEQAYEAILTFVKEKEDDNDIVSKIKTLKPKDALKFVKEESEKTSLTGEEELKQWIDDGILKIIDKGPKGTFWAKPLSAEFFRVAQCRPITGMGSHVTGEFGIGCQKGSNSSPAGFGAVGFGGNQKYSNGDTYTLLAKSKDGYYTGVLSMGGNPSDNRFLYHALQFGNKVIGSEALTNFGLESEDLLNAFVNFLINNKYGKKIYKPERPTETTNELGEVISDSTQLPSQMVSIQSNRKALIKMAQNHEEFLKYYEKALKDILSEEEYSLLMIKARELYEKNPKTFISNLPTYLKSEKSETLKILSEINFEDFISRYGEEVILKNIETILKIMDYNKFQNLIKPYISYDKFIEKTDKNKIKEIIRNFSEKAQNVKSTLPIVKSFIESEADFLTLLNNFGNGDKEKGLTAFLNVLATPRMSKHKDYLKSTEGVFSNVEKVVFKDFDGARARVHKNGNILLNPTTGEVYDENGNLLDFDGNNERKFEYVESNQKTTIENAEIKESQWILDYKSIRKLLKENKDVIINILGGGKRGEVKFVEYIIRNSNLQDREKELKNILDDYISIYDKLYKEKKSDVPGVLRYTKMLNFLLPRDYYIQEMIGDLSKDYESKSSIIYKVDKKVVEMAKNKQMLLVYYASKSKGSKSDKLSNACSAYIQTLTFSNSSVMKIEEETKAAINFLQKQNVDISSILQFVINVLEIIPTEFKSSLKELIELNVLSEKSSLGYIVNTEMKGYDANTGISTPNEDVSNKARKIKSYFKLNESSVKNYIQKLLQNNFIIK